MVVAVSEVSEENDDNQPTSGISKTQIKLTKKQRIQRWKDQMKHKKQRKARMKNLDQKRAEGEECPACGVMIPGMSNMSFHIDGLHPAALPSDELMVSCFSRNERNKNTCIFCNFYHPDGSRKFMKLHLLCKHKQEITEMGYKEPDEIFTEKTVGRDAIDFILTYCRKKQIAENYRLHLNKVDRTYQVELTIPGVDFMARGMNSSKKETERSYKARLRAAQQMKTYILQNDYQLP